MKCIFCDTRGVVLNTVIHNAEMICNISSYKACVWVVQGGVVKLPALTNPVRRRMYILLFKFRLFVCACLCPLDDWYFG